MKEAIWTYLTAPENRDTLTWLGGGVAAVAAALWTAITFFAGRNGSGGSGGGSAEPARQEIRADRGGQAAGGNINQNSGNTTRISTGVSGWQLVTIAGDIGGVALLAIAQVGNRVTADNGSVGVGGDVKGSSITVGQ